MQIFIHRDGQQLGPFTEVEIRAQLAAGTTSLQDNVWWEGQQGWVPISQTAFGVPGTPTALGTAPSVSYPAGVVTAPTSKLALWSLIAGCLSLFCSLFASIPAIIMGHMSLSEIKKNPGMQGRGMALAGTIIGYVFTGLILIYIVCVILFVSLSSNVKDVFKTINSQLAAQQAAADATNSSSTTAPSDQTTNAAPADTTTPPATPTPDTSTNTPSTNAPDSTTNAAPMNQ